MKQIYKTLKKILLSKFILRILITFIFLSCDYKNTFDINEVKIDDFNNWTKEAGIELLLDNLIPPPFSNKNVYQLTLINILDDESSGFESGTTGNWQESANNPGTSNNPSVFANIPNPGSFYGNRCLEIKLAREPDNEYIYYDLTTPTNNKEYIMTAHYRNITGANSDIYMSYGTPGNDLNSTIINSLNGEEGLLLYEFSILNAGNYQIRFGLSDTTTFTTTFSLILDKIALYEKSNHSISYYANIKNKGIYSFSVWAKTSDEGYCTLRIDGDTKSFLLSSSWKELKITSNIYSSKIMLEILPVSFVAQNKFPDTIYISSPKLEFLYE